MRTIILFLTAVATWAQTPTALDRYVAAPDPNYAWSVVKTTEGMGLRATLIDLTSQKWLTDAEVDRPVWKHWLTVIRPETVRGTTAFLFITGGANDGREPRVDGTLAEIARDTESIVAELRMVPNQPVKFPDAEKATYEDATIAYTWDKFLKTGDEKWPLRLPMTKAAVRAMDTVTAFAASDLGGKATVTRFFVSGASKRGWTTWTTAAADKRVAGIAPLVIDVLNVEKSMTHHFRAYGFFAPAVGDYQNKDLMGWMGTPENARLMAIEDPYSYRTRYTMPKFIVNSSGDQFFLPDSSQFYFDGLPGEKHLRYVPNTDHSLRNSDAAQSLNAFYGMLVRDQPRPRYQWKVMPDGFEISFTDRPTAVKLWTAVNPEARDFRLETLGPKYVSTQIAVEMPVTRVRLTAPARGFQAAFVEMSFPSGGKHPLKVTTPVKVLPERYPFPPPRTRAAASSPQ